MKSTIGVLLVEEVGFVRERLAELLAGIDGVQIVGQAGDAHAATSLLQKLQPDVVVLDIDIPGRGGIELLEAIRKGSATPVTIALSDYDFHALRRCCANLGANFFLYKPDAFEGVVEVCQNLLRARDGAKAARAAEAPDAPLIPGSAAMRAPGARPGGDE
jgi:DNA-binding NarL/FixJ family response regulator